jgi:hypothetical protein
VSHLVYDVYPSDTLLTGGTASRLVRLDSKLTVGTKFKRVKLGSGGGTIVMDATDTDAEALHDEALCLAFDLDVSTTIPRGAIVLDAAQQKLIGSGPDAGMITWQGPGALSVLSRARFLEEWYAPGQGGRGSWTVQEPLKWIWLQIALGAIVTRGMEEGQFQPGTPIATISQSFSRELDSGGLAWTLIPERYEIATGDALVDLLTDAIRLGLIPRMRFTSAPAMILDLFQSIGTDHSGAAFGAGVVRWTPENIIGELPRRKAATERVKRLIVVGRGIVETVIDATAPVEKWGRIDVDSDDPAVLIQAGQTALASKKLLVDSASFQINEGNDPDNGLVQPGTHFDEGDTARLHTGSGALDYDEVDMPIASSELRVLEGGETGVFVELGTVAVPSDARDLNAAVRAIVRGGPHGPELCRISAHFEAVIASNQSPDAASGVVSVEYGYVAPGGALTTIWDSATDPTPTTVNLSVNIARWFARVHRSSSPTTVTYYSDDPVHCSVATVGSTITQAWEWTVDWVGVSDFDDTVVVLTLLAGEQTGTSIMASRCDHRHHVLRTTTPTADDDKASGYPLTTLWTQVDDLDDPTTVVSTWLSVDDTNGAAVWLPLDSSGGLTIEEEDGTPTGAFDTLKVPNRSLTDNGDGSASLEAVLPRYGGLETVQAHGNMGSAETIDAANANWHTGTLDANCTLTLTGPTSGKGCTIILELLEDGTGGRTITLPASVVNRTELEAAQVTTADTVAFLVLLTRDGGTNWYGFWAGGAAAAAALIVREVGGSDINPVAELEFDADDFVVTDQTGGVARVALSAPGGGSDTAWIVDPGTPSYSGSGPVTVALTSKFGIDGSGNPYYNAANVTDGEEAALVWDSVTGTYSLRPYYP